MIMYFGSQAGKINGFTITVAVYAVLMILGYWYIYKITAGKEPAEETVTEAGRERSRQSLGEIVGLVFKNPPLLLLIISETFRNLMILVTTAFAFYYFSYVLKDLAFMTVFLLATSIANVIGAFASTWIGIRMGKRSCYWIFLILAAAAYASARFFCGTAWGFTIIFCVASFLANIAGSMNTALFSDTVIYGEWKTGKNIRAFTMALLNFPIKMAVLIRSAIVTLGLVAIGFVANAAPAPGVVSGISSIMTFTPAAACAIAALVFYYGYKIEDRQVVKMQEEIAAR